MMKTNETTTLKTGGSYDMDSLIFAGWTAGDGSGTEGYAWRDYFSIDGYGSLHEYLGADECGIEPQFRVLPGSRREIADAVVASRVCDPETVTDWCIDTWKQGGDWRSELAGAIDRDPAERARMGFGD